MQGNGLETRYCSINYMKTLLCFICKKYVKSVLFLGVGGWIGWLSEYRKETFNGTSLNLIQFAPIIMKPLFLQRFKKNQKHSIAF